MATLTEDPGKRGKTYRIGFINTGRQRKTVRIGAMPRKKAETVRAHIDQLEACLFDGSAPPPQTAAWLAGVGDVLRKRMEKAGLVDLEQRVKVPTLAELVRQYKARPKWQALKPNTVRGGNSCANALLARFGGDTRIDHVTEADAEDFLGHMVASKEQGGEGYAESTAMMVTAFAHRLFRFAIKSRYIAQSPFAEVPRGVCHRGNNVFVSANDVAKVMDELPNSEWRMLLGLARWGGLRSPSETRRLRWCDVDWARKRLLVHSPKTERHAGKESRWLPIFPELMPLLQERWDEAGEGEEFVLPNISKHRNNAGPIRSASRRAGVAEWPRCFHSLRSSRQTELEQVFPTYVVCAWLGNSESIARKHYLQVTDGHFEKAAQKAAQTASAKPSHDATIAPGAVAELHNCLAVAEVVVG